MKFQRGFTLLEVMVVISLSAVLGGVMLVLFQTQNRALASLDERLSQFETLQEVQEILQDPESCSATLKELNAISVAEGTIRSLKSVRGTQIVPVLVIEPELSRRTGILSYRLEGKVLAATDSGDGVGHYADSSNGYVDFWVKFSRKYGAPQSKRIRLRAVTVSSDDRRITYCYALGG